MNLDRLKQRLMTDEGIKQFPYKDTVGKLTIGIGRNLDDVGISQSEALYLLGNDIQRVSGQLDTKMPWWKQLDDVRQEVLVNMAFNMGIAGLLTFKDTLKAIFERRFDDASELMLKSKWAGQVGHRAVVLAQMMETGHA